MKNSIRLPLILVALSLSACASYQEVREKHPVMTRFVEVSLVISAAGVLTGGNASSHSSGPEVSAQPVNCNTGSCK